MGCRGVTFKPSGYWLARGKNANNGCTSGVNVSEVEVTGLAALGAKEDMYRVRRITAQLRRNGVRTLARESKPLTTAKNKQQVSKDGAENRVDGMLTRRVMMQGGAELKEGRQQRSVWQMPSSVLACRQRRLERNPSASVFPDGLCQRRWRSC